MSKTQVKGLPAQAGKIFTGEFLQPIGIRYTEKQFGRRDDFPLTMNHWSCQLVIRFVYAKQSR
jgi:hypothetical protein